MKVKIKDLKEHLNALPKDQREIYLAKLTKEEQRALKEEAKEAPASE